MKNILVFPCGSEIAREVLDALRYHKDYKIYGGASTKDKGEYLPYDAVIQDIPHVNDQNFIKEVKRVIEQYNIDYIFPCHDDVSLVLSASVDKLPCKVVTHSHYVNNVCRNKDTTYSIFQDKPFCPVYQAELFPRFVKPKNSNGSRGAELIMNEAMLSTYFTEFDRNNTLELEYLPGDEFTVDCFSQNGKLMFHGARQRNTSKMGIAEISTEHYDERITAIAYSINDTINVDGNGFNGAWFFQLKKDYDNNYKLLEIGSRVSGGMSFYRMKGVNFPELSILAADGVSCEIIPLASTPHIKSFSKFFTPLFQYSIEDYDNVYVDFDDTLYLHKTKKINTDIIKLLFQELDKGKQLVLITRSSIDFRSILSKYRIERLFDSIIHLDPANVNTKKENLIDPRSIFIDDSFRERNFHKDQVYCFGLDNFKILLDA
jgi:hypothetical protein